jgi:hypothetical protein
MSERQKKTPEAFTTAEAESQPVPVPEALSGATDEAFRAAAAYVVAKNAELYRRLAQGPTGRQRPDDARGAARRPVTDRSHTNRASPDDADRPAGSA